VGVRGGGGWGGNTSPEDAAKNVLGEGKILLFVGPKGGFLDN